MTANPIDWNSINKLAEEYSKLVTAPDKKEIIYRDGRMTDLRTPKQTELAGQIIQELLPYVKELAKQLLYNSIFIDQHKISRNNAADKFEPQELVNSGVEGIISALGRYDPARSVLGFKPYCNYILGGKMKTTVDRETLKENN